MANGDSTGKKSTGKSRTQGEAFKRVQDDQWVGGLKKGFDDNTYEVRLCAHLGIIACRVRLGEWVPVCLECVVNHSGWLIFEYS